MQLDDVEPEAMSPSCSVAICLYQALDLVSRHFLRHRISRTRLNRAWSHWVPAAFRDFERRVRLTICTASAAAMKKLKSDLRTPTLGELNDWPEGLAVRVGPAPKVLEARPALRRNRSSLSHD